MKRALNAFWLVLAAGLVGFSVPLARAAEDIDALIAKQVVADGPGMAMAVIEKGKVVFHKGYGLANIANKVAITPKTTFELASVSKQFTAMAIMILHDRGKLHFDDDVRKYLPELPQYEKKHPIHIRELLHHTSGLPEYFGFPNVKGKDPKFLCNDDYLPLFASHLEKFPLQFPTGQKYQYTNSNYLVLASVVERLSGKSFGTFMAEEIFKPLEMTTTVVFENPKIERHHFALGYKKKKGSFEIDMNEKLLTAGDGAIWTCLDDMIRWDAGLHEGKLVKPETMALALRPSKTHDGKTNAYGFGWGLTFDDKGKLLAMSHNGAWTGYRTSIERNLGEQRTVIVLGNCSAFDVDQTVAAIGEHFRSRLLR